MATVKKPDDEDVKMEDTKPEVVKKDDDEIKVDDDDDDDELPELEEEAPAARSKRLQEEAIRADVKKEKEQEDKEKMEKEKLEHESMDAHMKFFAFAMVVKKVVEIVENTTEDIHSEYNVLKAKLKRLELKHRQARSDMLAKHKDIIDQDKVNNIVAKWLAADPGKEIFYVNDPELSSEKLQIIKFLQGLPSTFKCDVHPVIKKLVSLELVFKPCKLIFVVATKDSDYGLHHSMLAVALHDTNGVLIKSREMELDDNIRISEDNNHCNLCEDFLYELPLLSRILDSSKYKAMINKKGAHELVVEGIIVYNKEQLKQAQQK